MSAGTRRSGSPGSVRDSHQKLVFTVVIVGEKQADAAFSMWIKPLSVLYLGGFLNFIQSRTTSLQISPSRLIIILSHITTLCSVTAGLCSVAMKGTSGNNS